MNRRQFLTVGGIALTGTAALGVPFLVNSFKGEAPAEKEIPVLEQIVEAASKSSDAEIDNLRLAFSALENENYPALSIDESGKISPITKPYDPKEGIGEKSVILARPDSAFLGPFYIEMGKSNFDMVRSNVRYLLFAPNVTRDLGFMKDPAEGVSLGNGAIMIDSAASFLSIPGVVRHEASHELNKGKLQTLDSEANAIDSQISVLEHQIDSRKDGRNWELYELERIAAGLKEVRYTASYLRRFGQAFREVYPINVILSKDLLAAKVDAAELNKIVQLTFGMSDFAQELHYASKAAHAALTQPREKAVMALHDIVAGTAAPNIEKINALFALGYLAPEALKLRVAPSNQGRGMRVSINDAFMLDLGYYEGDLMPDANWKAVMEAHERYVQERKREPLKKGTMVGYAIPTRTSRFIAYGDLPPIENIFRNKASPSNKPPVILMDPGDLK